MQTTCKRHGIFAKYHCPVCHRALCTHCTTRDGCCSRRCAWRRRKFGVVGRKGPEDETSCGAALLKVVLAAAVLAGAPYAAHRAGVLPG